MTRTIMKVAAAIIALLFFTLNSNAQNYQNVVYLKNGSIIRGLIMEQVPEKSLKIVTPNGSTIFCTLNEVEKITKELPAGQENSSRRSEYGWLPAPRYRGFVEESAIIGTGEFALNRTQVLTSHGCQINPYLYIGGGLGVNYWIDDEYFTLPLFAHVRSEIHKAYNKRVSPYLDTKIGYSLGDFHGFYCLPSAGCHIYFGKSKLGLSAAIGYNVQLTEVYYYHADISEVENLGGVSISLAFDF